MKTMFLRTIVLATTLCCLAPAYAEGEAPKKEPSAKQLAQRAKMKACNAEAKPQKLSRDERRAFMKTCLSNGGAAPEDTAVKETKEIKDKRKTCGAEAKEKGLKGDERKTFMTTCVGG